MAKKNQFAQEEAGSLVENNLVVVGTGVIEQSFEQALRYACDFGDGWQLWLVRAGLLFVAYNGIKYWTLLKRDENGWTAARKVGAWIWVKLFGE